MDRFIAEYAKQLSLAVQNYPDEYVYPVAYVPVVVEKMRDAFRLGTFNKDGRAIKATCKALGINYTYAAINAYLRQEASVAA